MARRNNQAPVNQAASSGSAPVRADGTGPEANITAPQAPVDNSITSNVTQAREKPVARSLAEKDGLKEEKALAARYNGIKLPPTKGKAGETIALRRIKNGTKGFFLPGDVLSEDTAKLLESEDGLTLKL